MADATFDVVMVGGGTKALPCALYLAGYGGMSVAVVEREHECGGGWCSTDYGGFYAAPHSMAHAYWYHSMPDMDFPGINAEVEWVAAEISQAVIFKEDQHAICLYYIDYDPTGDRTYETVRRYSERDAETLITFRNWYHYVYRDAFLADAWSLPPPPGEPTALEKLMAHPEIARSLDPGLYAMSIAQFCRTLFEHPAMQNFFLRSACASGILPDDEGMGLFAPFASFNIMDLGGSCRGSPHSPAHVYVRRLAGHGAKIFTHCEVEKILVESGRARGVRLTDGTEIEARKAVVTTLDPHQVVFRLLGKEMVSPYIRTKIAALQRFRNCLCWYSWYMKERPQYLAGADNPELNNNSIFQIVMTDMDVDAQLREAAYRRLGQNPPEVTLLNTNFSTFDTHWTPPGTSYHAGLTEAYMAPADRYSDTEWIEHAKRHADYVVKTWGEYAPNVTWDNVFMYDPCTPWHTAKRLKNMAPTGSWSVVDLVPAQAGIRNRPIPELANHRVPEIKNLYCTGTAWGFYPGASSCQGYTCYKAIAEDMGLRKPWEEQGRPY